MVLGHPEVRNEGIFSEVLLQRNATVHVKHLIEWNRIHCETALELTGKPLGPVSPGSPIFP